ncbi:hypothetical protein C8E97_3068 [Saccharothrix australiensis]|uniref:Terpene synthase family protein n=2 Tax=Saccharothrix australiensis TaxID=2072 RepID=A0A495VYP1_9PSEU|nr:hypothetical protein C8E97_3068 [Saccharothrix australiensis]
MGLAASSTVFADTALPRGVSGLGPYLDPAGGAGTAQLASDFVEWSFALEAAARQDFSRPDVEDFPALAQRLLGVLQRPGARGAGGGPLPRALADLSRRVERLHPSAVDAWTARVRNHVVARRWEYGCRSRHGVPGFGHYVTRRRSGIAALCVLTLPRRSDPGLGSSATLAARRLALAAVDVIGLDHDVALYPLVLRSGPFPLNAATCIERHEGHPWDVAIYRTVQRRDEIMAAFVRGCEFLDRRADTALRSTLSRLRDCVSGHIAWLRRSGLPRLPPRPRCAADAVDDW